MKRSNLAFFNEIAAHLLGARNDATGKGVASLSQDLEKIISLNYWQWDDNLKRGGFMILKILLGLVIGGCAGFIFSALFRSIGSS